MHDVLIGKFGGNCYMVSQSCNFCDRSDGSYFHEQFYAPCHSYAPFVWSEHQRLEHAHCSRSKGMNMASYSLALAMSSKLRSASSEQQVIF